MTEVYLDHVAMLADRVRARRNDGRAVDLAELDELLAALPTWGPVSPASGRRRGTPPKPGVGFGPDRPEVVEP